MSFQIRFSVVYFRFSLLIGTESSRLPRGSPTEPYGGAIDNYAQPDSGTFAWGGPFFFGRQVYITLNKSTSPFGTGPFYAF